MESRPGETPVGCDGVRKADFLQAAREAATVSVIAERR